MFEPVASLGVAFESGSGPALYRVLGPLAAGLVVREVRWFLSAKADAIVNIGAAIGGSSDATQVGFLSGIPFISGLPSVPPSVPSMHVRVRTGEMARVDMPVNRVVVAGSQFVIIAVGQSGTVTTLEVAAFLVLESGVGRGAWWDQVRSGG